MASRGRPRVGQREVVRAAGVDGQRGSLARLQGRGAGRATGHRWMRLLHRERGFAAGDVVLLFLRIRRGSLDGVAAGRQTSRVHIAGRAGARNLSTACRPAVGDGVLGIEVLRIDGRGNRIARPDFSGSNRAAGRRWLWRPAAHLEVQANHRSSLSHVKQESFAAGVIGIQITPADKQSEHRLGLHIEGSDSLVVETGAASAGVATSGNPDLGREGDFEMAAGNSVNPVGRGGVGATLAGRGVIVSPSCQ